MRVSSSKQQAPVIPANIPPKGLRALEILAEMLVRRREERRKAAEEMNHDGSSSE